MNTVRLAFRPRIRQIWSNRSRCWWRAPCRRVRNRRPARPSAAPKSGFHCNFTLPPVTGRVHSVRLVVKGDLAPRSIDILHRHVKHPTRLGMDRQKDRIGLLPFLAQTGQHDLHERRHSVRRHSAGSRRTVPSDRNRALTGIRTRTRTYRGTAATSRCYGHRSCRMRRRTDQAPMSAASACARPASLDWGTLSGTLRIPSRSSEKQISLVGISEITSNARRTIVVRKHLSERPDMRQAAGAVTRLEQHMTLLRWRLLIAFRNAARLFERPGLGCHRSVAQIGHIEFPIGSGPLPEPAPLPIAHMRLRQ